MRIVIDKETCTFALHLCPRTANAIEGDASLQRTYSALTLQQLQALYRNTTGFAIECPDYNATLQACKYLALCLLSTTTEREEHGNESEEKSG